MTLPYRCRIYGRPVAWARPRAQRRGEIVHVFEQSNVTDWKRTVQVQVIETRPIVPFGGPLDLTLEFVLPRPKTLPKRVLHHVKRPDLDNLVKAVTDAVNGILYRDDSQLVQIIARKVYGDRPGVRIHLAEYGVRVPGSPANGDGDLRVAAPDAPPVLTQEG